MFAEKLLLIDLDFSPLGDEGEYVWAPNVRHGTGAIYLWLQRLFLLFR